MLPTHQCFDAIHAVRSQVELRLVVKRELASLECVPQLPLESLPRLHLGVHFWLEQAEPASAVLLGPIERHICLPDQLVFVLSTIQRDCNADARRNVRLLRLERERRCESVDQSFRQYRRTVWPGEAGLDKSELVAAETSQKSPRGEPPPGAAQLPRVAADRRQDDPTCR